MKKSVRRPPLNQKYCRDAPARHNLERKNYMSPVALVSRNNLRIMLLILLLNEISRKYFDKFDSAPFQSTRNILETPLLETILRIWHEPVGDVLVKRGMSSDRPHLVCSSVKAPWPSCREPVTFDDEMRRRDCNNELLIWQLRFIVWQCLRNFGHFKGMSINGHSWYYKSLVVKAILNIKRKVTHNKQTNERN